MSVDNRDNAREQEAPDQQQMAAPGDRGGLMSVHKRCMNLNRMVVATVEEMDTCLRICVRHHRTMKLWQRQRCRSQQNFIAVEADWLTYSVCGCGSKPGTGIHK